MKKIILFALFISLIINSCIPLKEQKIENVPIEKYFDTWIGSHSSELTALESWGPADKVSQNSDGTTSLKYRKSTIDFNKDLIWNKNNYFGDGHALYNINFQTDKDGFITNYKYDYAVFPKFEECKLNYPGRSKNAPIIENLGPNLNSQYSELAPVITPDGNTLYFVRDGHPENTGFNKYQDIWYSELVNGQWQRAIIIGSPLNTNDNNAVASVTPDGNTLMLMNEYVNDGTLRPGFSYSERSYNGWRFPENIKMKNYYNMNQYVEYNLTNDRNTILMTIQRQDSYGARDIYFSKRLDDKTWSEPFNLGDVVNTPADEMSPFMAADGVTLYFSSAGHCGYGKMDVFKTTRLDDTFKNWSKPENLGPDINTTDWDAYYKIAAKGDYAYFVSTSNSYGESDIFKVKLPEKAKPNPVVLISGIVYDKETNKPMSAEIIYELSDNSKKAGSAISNPNTGEYKIVLPAGKSYGVRATAPKYLSFNDIIDVSSVTDYKEMNYDLFLTPVKEKQSFVLNNIFFDTGKYELRPESYNELNKLFNFLTENNVSIEIGGHTDDVGNDNDNLVLSENRANSVRQYLIDKGIESSRISHRGYGETMPVTQNTTPEGRQKNRRVEFTIIKMN